MEEKDIRYFIDTFIRKEKRERLLYELTTPKKQYAGLSRFCHNAEDLLDRNKIRMEGKDLENRSGFQQFVKLNDGLCLILSPELYPEECRLPLSEAVSLAAFSSDAVVILGSDFAVVFSEAIKGGRDKYLLCAG